MTDPTEQEDFSQQRYMRENARLAAAGQRLKFYPASVAASLIRRVWRLIAGAPWRARK